MADSSFVLDCSVAVSWCFADEASEAGDALLRRLAADGAVVPGLWFLELANVLLGAVRRGRASHAEIHAFLGQLERLPVTKDAKTADRAFGQTLALAAAHDLTAYDAAYLELAMRRGLPLATRDAALIRAARATGVELLDC